MPEYSQETRGAAMHDSLVNDCIHRGLTEGQIIAVLMRRHVAISAELMKMVSIVPKRYTKDGVSYIWHCPDELIPATNL